MINAIRELKKLVLFLFGVFLIMCGYKINTPNNRYKIDGEQEDAPKEIKILPSSPVKT